MLTGGNATAGVVRVGATVRKPWLESTPTVRDFMHCVREAGIDVPEFIGRDDDGRQVLEYVPGRLAIESQPLTHVDLARIGALVRAIHDASAAFVPPRDAVWHTAIPAPGDDLVCHNDLAPWNLIIGERWVFIDWDAAAPSTRLWDLAYAAQTFTLSDVHLPPGGAAANLSAFVEGYDADHSLRAGLPDAMHRRAAAMHRLLKTSHEAGREPWGSMHAEGHGAHWAAVTDYVARHRSVWCEALLPKRPGPSYG